MSRHSTMSTKPRASPAFSSGWQAGLAGRGKKSNPFRRTDPRRYQWEWGRQQGERERE